ncbi:response regulator [Haloferula sargassicola]|uniref:Transcriptional regulatory protein WalR n=1 Tax=Haloferula sargassicola TaxID=490096 RepID=A0ABP9UIR8_9BACT
MPDAPAPSASRLKVLIVDDGRNAADVMGMFFEMEGHQPKVVYDGLSAIEAIPEFEPDLVIMDLTMPGMDGLRAAREIRARHPHRELRMIACSGGQPEVDERLALEAGFDGHLPKPVTPAMLRECLADPLAG